MNIAERLRLLIATKISDHRRFKVLEDLSSISAESWRAFENDRQKPSAEMISTAARLWPDYAYWLASGDTEPERGHIAPKSLKIIYPIICGEPQEWATKERLYKQQLLTRQTNDAQELINKENGIEKDVQQQRKNTDVATGYQIFEKIMRGLGQPPKAEFFLLEANDDLHLIRKKRYEFEADLQLKTQNRRNNLHLINQISSITASIKNKWEKISGR